MTPTVRAAADLIHDALDADDDGFHDRDTGVIDTTSGQLATALLKAGWRPPAPASHECDFPPGVTDSEQRYYECPVCGAHWVKMKRMVGRTMYRSWHRMSDEQVARRAVEAKNVRPA